MSGESRNVVIIGGGITGLTAAYYMQEAVKKQRLPINITLIEASRRLGGKIQTIHRDGYVIERGPASFMDTNMSATRLVNNLGIKEELMASSTGKSYVLVNDKLHSIPKGLVMGIPTKLLPFLTTNLFSISGKFRAAADYVIPRSNKVDDQSLGSFFRRRLGDEVVENLIEPLLSGFYAGDIDQQSLLSTFPQMYDVQKDYRSLIMGMKKLGSQRTSHGAGGYLTLKNGLESLISNMEKSLCSCTVMKGIKVNSINKNLDHKDYSIRLNNGEQLQADSVIVSLPHSSLPSLFSEISFFKFLLNIPTTSVATVTVAFSESAILKKINGNGFVVSRNSDYTINACTWTHNKWPNLTPKGKVLLRCDLGRAGDEAVVDLSDAEIEQIVLSDLNKTLGITSNPEFCVITRWKNAMPQYTVGHQERLNKMTENLEKNLPGIFLVGSSFGGVGISDCIEQGETAVNSVLQYLKQKNSF